MYVRTYVPREYPPQTDTVNRILLKVNPERVAGNLGFGLDLTGSTSTRVLGTRFRVVEVIKGCHKRRTGCTTI